MCPRSSIPMEAAPPYLTGVPSTRGDAKDDRGRRTLLFPLLLFLFLFLFLFFFFVVAMLYRCMSICVELFGARGGIPPFFRIVVVSLRVRGADFLATRPPRAVRFLRQRASERAAAAAAAAAEAMAAFCCCCCCCCFA